MKSSAQKCLAGLMLLAALAITVQLAAQDQLQNKKHSRYSVKDLGSLGGTFGEANGINNRRASATYLETRATTLSCGREE